LLASSPKQVLSMIRVFPVLHSTQHVVIVATISSRGRPQQIHGYGSYYHAEVLYYSSDLELFGYHIK